MIPVDMRQLMDLEHGLRGDCFRACIASVLELPLEHVPHFLQISETRKKMCNWLVMAWLIENCGVGYIELSIIRTQHGEYFLDPYNAHQMLVEFFPTYTILCGPGPRGVRHCCVGLGLDIVHDPHPSRAGLLKKEDAIFFPKWSGKLPKDYQEALQIIKESK